MEKTTLEALEWRVERGDVVVPSPKGEGDKSSTKGAGAEFNSHNNGATTKAIQHHKDKKHHGGGGGGANGPANGLTIKRRFQFSSALKRMSTVSSLPPSLSGSSSSLLIAVKGAPETIKDMLKVVPEGYDEVYKGYTRRGSRVLALGMREEGGGAGREKVRLLVQFLVGFVLVLVSVSVSFSSL